MIETEVETTEWGDEYEKMINVSVAIAMGLSRGGDTITVDGWDENEPSC
jgi:hypothetical protein